MVHYDKRPPAQTNLKWLITAKLLALSRLGAALLAYMLCVLIVELNDSHQQVDFDLPRKLGFILFHCINKLLAGGNCWLR